MASPTSSPTVVDREFLEMRAKILELAASFDRIDREGLSQDHPRYQQLRKAIEILLQDSGSRAEQVQMLFSRVYEQDWRQQFGI